MVAGTWEPIVSEDSTRRFVTSGVSVSTLVTNCKAIIDVHIDLTSAQRKQVKKMVDTIDNLMKTRNSLVHGLLAEDQSDTRAASPALAVLTNKHRKPFQSRTLTVDEAREAAEMLRTVASELLVWTFQTLPAASQQQVLPPLKGN